MMMGARAGVEDAVAADETAMMARARSDPAAFAPLYERYFARIYRYCLRRTGQPEEAEDLSSVVFTHAIAGRAGYRGGSVAAWLFGIAHNATANHLRARRPQIARGTAEAAIAALPALEEAPPDYLVRVEERRAIARLIAALPEDQRELLTLRVTGELSAKEIGAVVGKSEGAVRVALHRIMQQLRRRYTQLEEETG